MTSAWDRVLELAEDQWGLVTRRQVEARGVAWSTLSRMAGRGEVERVAHGVYRLRGAPPADQADLRAAWLQLAPSVPVWERNPAQGVVSHRSAARLYELGELPADVHEFTLPARRQSRRSDVRLHRRDIEADAVRDVGGLLVTRPARVVADLLADAADAEAVGRIAAESIAAGQEHPADLAGYLAPFAGRFHRADGDGPAVLSWLLDLAGVSPADRSTWLGRAGAVR